MIEIKRPILNLNNNKRYKLYDLKNFSPKIVDEKYLREMGIDLNASTETLNKLALGSKKFIEKFDQKKLHQNPEYSLDSFDLNSEIEIHNYTGKCPTMTYELNPVSGGCNVGCLYCLVSDGEHSTDIVAHEDYHLFVRKILTIKKDTRHFFYLSAKTEAFQEPTLETGIAHNILREFIAHYEDYPESKTRLFIASKAGTKQLLYSHNGETILDLFEKLKGKMQFNTSIGIMPDPVRDVLEPNAASVEERLKAVKLCQSRGVMSESVLTQPIILPYLTETVVDEFFSQVQKAGIINFKPEFLTLCPENLAMIGQIVGYFNKELEKKMYTQYLSAKNAGHVKQRQRTAPERDQSKKSLMMLKNKAEKYGISTSICFWVRRELEVSNSEIPVINSNGFQCLGYQTELLK